MKNLKTLRAVGWMEGISYLMLFGITMPLKYMHNMPMPNKIVGMLHGILFMAYIGYVFIVRSDLKWNNSKTFWALLASVLPFGTFVADKKLFRPKY